MYNNSHFPKITQTNHLRFEMKIKEKKKTERNVTNYRNSKTDINELN